MRYMRRGWCLPVSDVDIFFSAKYRTSWIYSSPNSNPHSIHNTNIDQDIHTNITLEALDKYMLILVDNRRLSSNKWIFPNKDILISSSAKYRTGSTSSPNSKPQSDLNTNLHQYINLDNASKSRYIFGYLFTRNQFSVLCLSDWDMAFANLWLVGISLLDKY